MLTPEHHRTLAFYRQRNAERAAQRQARHDQAHLRSRRARIRARTRKAGRASAVARAAKRAERERLLIALLVAETSNQKRFKDRLRHYRCHYGLSVDALHATYTAQRKACAICCVPSPLDTLQADHCHTSGNFRALLCPRCNITLGFARDNIQILQNAIAYLARHSPPPPPAQASEKQGEM